MPKMHRDTPSKPAMGAQLMARWSYTLGPDGIVTIALEVELTPAAGGIDAAMTRLAAVAVVEAAAPRIRKHGEPA